MGKYVYPAIFTQEKDESFSVVFPDVDGCYTCGNDLAEAMAYAADALALMMYHLEKEKLDIPTATAIEQVNHKRGSFVSYISCDTLEYQRRNNKNAVKKTLSIPEWMDVAATEAGINFSKVLQDALKEKLHIA